MAQKTSPFLEGKYGWNYGESGWNLGMDENLLKFSFMFDRNVDGIVSSLPAATSGAAYFLLSDNRIYYAVNNIWYSTPTPKWFLISLKSTGVVYQFDGEGLVQVTSNEDLNDRLQAVELTVSTLGTAAYRAESYFATPGSVATAKSEALSYTDSAVVAKISASDLANTVDPTKGAALVGYRSRTVKKRLEDVVYITDFGADPTGVSDCSVALLNALAVSQQVHFPAGKYRFNSQVNYTIPNPAVGAQATAYIGTLTLTGEGADRTILYWPSTSGLNITYASQQHSVHISDLSITTGAQNAGSGLRLTNSYPYFGTFVAQSELRNVTFRGDDGYAFSGGAAGKYWTNGVSIANVSDVTFFNCNFYGNSNGNVGTGVFLDSPGAGTFVPANTGLASSFTTGTVYNLVACNFSFLSRGVYYGNNIQTVTLNGCFFGNGQNAVVCPDGIHNNSNQGLIITGCSAFLTADHIVINSPINNIQINNNFFAVNTGARGIFIAPMVNLSVLGNQFLPYGNPNTAAAGIEVQGLVPGAVQTIDLLTVGSGYTVGAAATVSGGGGTGFAATVGSVNSSGGITSVVITNRGSGYTTAPTVSFPVGTGATFRVLLQQTVLQIIDGNTFSSVTNGIILDNYSSNVRVGISNCYTPFMTNQVLDAGINNITALKYDVAGVRLTKPTASLGYGAGSGASVTQLTSKATPVTINNVCGVIVTSNASLASGAEVGFIVNNTNIAASDIVFVTGSNGNYMYRVTDTGAGVCTIRVKNNTASPLSDAVNINFAVFKSSQS